MVEILWVISLPCKAAIFPAYWFSLPSVIKSLPVILNEVNQYQRKSWQEILTVAVTDRISSFLWFSAISIIDSLPALWTASVRQLITQSLDMKPFTVQKHEALMVKTTTTDTEGVLLFWSILGQRKPDIRVLKMVNSFYPTTSEKLFQLSSKHLDAFYLYEITSNMTS